MANLFSQKCDICSAVQTDEDPHKIKGTSVVMNGVAKFACGECRDLLYTAFSVGAEGIRDPMLALSKATQEIADLKRLLEQASVKREPGDLGMISLELDHKVAQNFNTLAQQEKFKALSQRFQPVNQLGQASSQSQTTSKLDYKDEKKKPKKK